MDARSGANLYVNYNNDMASAIGPYFFEKKKKQQSSLTTGGRSCDH